MLIDGSFVSKEELSEIKEFTGSADDLKKALDHAGKFKVKDGKIIEMDLSDEWWTDRRWS